MYRIFASSIRRFRLWAAGPELSKLVVERDEAQRAYIKCERKLSIYHPTTPVNISDEMIDRRLSYEISRKGGE